MISGAGRSSGPLDGLRSRWLADATTAQVSAFDRMSEGLEVLSTDLLRREYLTSVGRSMMAREVQRCISERLLLARIDIEHVERTLPLVVITGLPRTGTTFLHHLLATDPDNYCPPMWHLLCPASALAGDASGRATTDAHLRALEALGPDVQQLHPIGLDEPDECVSLLQLTGASERFLYLAELPAYQEWLFSRDMIEDYRLWFAWIQELGRASCARRIVVKAPAHYGRIAELSRHVPELHLVICHRQEAEVRHSFARLLSASHTITSTSPEESGRRVADSLIDWHLGRVNEHRPQASFNVALEDLGHDPLGTVEGLYSSMGASMSSELTDQLTRDAAALRAVHANSRGAGS